MSHQGNSERIKQVAAALGDLKDEVVFVGGTTLSFYSEIGIFEVRATDDVDVIIEAISYRAHTEFEERLRNKGFADDIESGIKCRYKLKGLVVDIMPTTDVFMGFKNIWYPDGFKYAINYELDDKVRVKILSPVYFLATKFEAFKNRGSKDPRTSQDFEDIVYLLESR